VKETKVEPSPRKPSPYRRYLYAFLDRFAISENSFMAFVAALIGVAAGLGNYAFRKLIHFFHWLVVDNGSHYFKLPMPTELAMVDWSPERLRVILFPAAGGVLMILLWVLFREDMKFSFSRFMEVINLRGAKIPGRLAFTRGLASAITLGTGGSAGQEGPIAQIGGAIASRFGLFAKMSGERLKILVACGASAGVAATFNAPIAGVFFGTEIILVSTFAFTSFTPIVIASTLSTAVTRSLLNTEVFQTPARFLNTPLELVLYVILGAAIGLLSAGQIDLHFKIKDLFDRLRIPFLLKPVCGGLLVGLIAVVFPQVMGNGYEFMSRSLNGEGTIAILLALALLKVLATALTYAGGLPGGLFAPVLVIGSFVGGAFGKIMLLLFPGLALLPGAFATVGMGAFLAGAMHAPATAIFLVFEITDSYEAILPMMLACVTATAVARWRKHDCLETVELTRDGIDLEAGKERNIMKSLRVRDVMEHDAETVPENMTLGQFLHFIPQAKNNSFPITNAQGELTGIIAVQDFLGVVLEKELSELVVIKELATLNVITTTEDEDLETALRKLGARDLNQLPVVDRETGKRVVGIINRRDIVTAYNRALMKRSLGEGSHD
jgi:CIC family chloride channel protein